MDALVRAWEAGGSVAQLAAQFGLHRSTVGRYLKERGINTLEARFDPEDLKQAAELYRCGRTLLEVAMEFGTTKKTIRKRLAEFGVTIRKGGRGGLAAEGQLA